MVVRGCLCQGLGAGHELRTIVGIPAAVDLHEEEVESPVPAVSDDLIQDLRGAHLIPHHPYPPPLAREAAADEKAEAEEYLKAVRQTLHNCPPTRLLVTL